MTTNTLRVIVLTTVSASLTLFGVLCAHDGFPLLGCVTALSSVGFSYLVGKRST